MRLNLLEVYPYITKLYERADARLSLLLTQIRFIQNLAVTENGSLFGSTSHLTIKFPPTSVKRFSNSYKNISHPAIGYTKSATKIISNLVIAAQPTWETS